MNAEEGNAVHAVPGLELKTFIDKTTCDFKLIQIFIPLHITEFLKNLC